MDSINARFQTKTENRRSFPVNWVSELIHEGSRSWDRNKLVECFDDETVNQVMLIPLSQFPQDDKLIWFPSRSGSFSTKTAFWIDQQPRFDNTGPFSKPEWKSLWKLKIHDRLTFMEACLEFSPNP